jgi:hypothetical protein
VPLFHLIYVSTLHANIGDEQIVSILHSSLKNNKTAGVTGMLLLSSSNVIQVLEGKEEAVVDLFQRIVEDPRHYDITELIREPIASRSFPEWSMGYRNLNLSPQAGNSTENKLFPLSFDVRELKANPGIAKTLLENFSLLNN